MTADIISIKRYIKFAYMCIGSCHLPRPPPAHTLFAALSCAQSDGGFSDQINDLHDMDD